MTRRDDTPAQAMLLVDAIAALRELANRARAANDRWSNDGESVAVRQSEELERAIARADAVVRRADTSAVASDR